MQAQEPILTQSAARHGGHKYLKESSINLKALHNRLKNGVDLIGLAYRLPVLNEIKNILHIQFWKLRLKSNIRWARKVLGMNKSAARYHGLKLTVKDSVEATITDFSRYEIWNANEQYKKSKPHWKTRFIERTTCNMGICFRYVDEIFSHPLLGCELGGLQASDEDKCTHALLLLIAGQKCVKENTHLRSGSLQTVFDSMHIDSKLKVELSDLIVYGKYHTRGLLKSLSQWAQKAARKSRAIEEWQTVPVSHERAITHLFDLLIHECDKWIEIHGDQPEAPAGNQI